MTTHTNGIVPVAVTFCLVFKSIIVLWFGVNTAFSVVFQNSLTFLAHATHQLVPLHARNSFFSENVQHLKGTLALDYINVFHCLVENVRYGSFLTRTHLLWFTLPENKRRSLPLVSLTRGKFVCCSQAMKFRWFSLVLFIQCWSFRCRSQFISSLTLGWIQHSLHRGEVSPVLWAIRAFSVQCCLLVSFLAKPAERNDDIEAENTLTVSAS